VLPHSPDTIYGSGAGSSCVLQPDAVATAFFYPSSNTSLLPPLPLRVASQASFSSAATSFVPTGMMDNGFECTDSYRRNAPSVQSRRTSYAAAVSSCNGGYYENPEDMDHLWDTSYTSYTTDAVPPFTVKRRVNSVYQWEPRIFPLREVESVRLFDDTVPPPPARNRGGEYATPGDGDDTSSSTESSSSIPDEEDPNDPEWTVVARPGDDVTKPSFLLKIAKL